MEEASEKHFLNSYSDEDSVYDNVNISIPESLSARDIINLPFEKRQEILAKQFQEAEHIYKENPENHFSP